MSQSQSLSHRDQERAYPLPFPSRLGAGRLYDRETELYDATGWFLHQAGVSDNDLVDRWFMDNHEGTLLDSADMAARLCGYNRRFWELLAHENNRRSAEDPYSRATRMAREYHALAREYPAREISQPTTTTTTTRILQMASDILSDQARWARYSAVGAIWRTVVSLDPDECDIEESSLYPDEPDSLYPEH